MNISENIQKSSIQNGIEQNNSNVLLLGGAGFLGRGLFRELSRLGYSVKVIDKADMDLSDVANIPDLAGLIPNFNYVFILASQIGAELFQSNAAFSAGIINRKIYENVMSAIVESRAKNLNLFYYSTSEVYWSMPSPDVFIDDNIVPGAGIDYDNPRSVYAAGKLYAERNLMDRFRFFGNDEFLSVNVIRPFNVYGPGQKRGVMYSMLKSGLSGRAICYSDDTTRTLTSLSYISEKTAGLMSKTGFRRVNMLNGISTYMETLALAVRKYLAWKFDLAGAVDIKKLPPDASIRYRQASAVVHDPDEVFMRLKESKDMEELSEEIMTEIAK